MRHLRRKWSKKARIIIEILRALWYNALMIRFNECMSRERARQISPVVLAFVGDAVQSLYVRESLVFSSDYKTGELQRLSAARVSAHGQAELLAAIEPRFTEEERDIFLRGRNAKKPTKSKNASVQEYVRSTGLEAVLGFLYLTGAYERIGELLSEVQP